MQRSCEVCGTAFEGQRVTARYCSTKCRTRASRAGTSKPRAVRPVEAVAPPTPPPATTAAPSAAPIPFDPDDASVTQVTVSALEAAGRLDTPLARAAIVLARRMDNGHRETGSGLAALARQLETTLRAATVGSGKEASSLDRARDDLAERRARAAARSA